ncbi:hypothetical protein PAXRUDRAFT_656965 [Paxillus rubicundulus Ve08.2h10]|uniref:Uncharacterized protein n=1 Tax=Paxillus rubicundulus Ve08.2h10 TaxID=930991 RepID=A0A0D0E3A2_9AGAM|nr:hypothetical protein PAXRUDRAFT_656965 [Paxillus rubicundulus Ve08.2h10]
MGYQLSIVWSHATYTRHHIHFSTGEKRSIYDPCNTNHSLAIIPNINDSFVCLHGPPETTDGKARRYPPCWSISLLRQREGFNLGVGAKERRGPVQDFDGRSRVFQATHSRWWNTDACAEVDYGSLLQRMSGFKR